VTKYNPPIESRDNDELIIISYSSPDEWQQDAIDQALKELHKRGISHEQQKKRISELEHLWEADLNKEIERRKTEDFTLFEMLSMVFIWPKALLYDWGLRREGYILKSKRRLQLIGLGIGLTFILIGWASFQNEISNKKLIEEIEKTDISEWEKNHIADTTTDEQHKTDTIEKKNTL